MKTNIVITALLALVALTTFGQSNIADTYWRNEQTGDWLIGFAEKHVIYNNKVWEIVGQTEKKDAYTLTVDNGDVIKVGKMKNGLRSIAIGKGKAVVCSQITTVTLPDYPTEDLTPFKDNGYRAGDTATIVGWLKDCPKEVLDQNREFDIEATSLFSRKDFNAYGKIDSLGRFVVKMPVENTQEVYMDWERTTLCTVLEPGETYFFLHDYKTGQKLFMGSNARVQNELLTHDIRQESAQLDRQGMTDQKVIDYKDRWADIYERNNARLDSVIMYHPTLSRRYEDYQRMDMLCEMASDVMQAMCFIKGWKLPIAVTSYVESQVWQSNRMKKPYTMVRNFSWVLYYYHMNAQHTNPLMAEVDMIDSLYADPLLRETCKARMLNELVDATRTPLTERYMAIANQIQHPAIRQGVLSLNDKYLAIQQRDISKTQSLKTNDDLAGMSDGEQILRKITEPYRGRLVLVDVWGTWCSPCKEALSRSKEEFERLKDFGLVYLYLANRSEDEAWKNVIKEYDLTGDDIVHYNLPTDQQSAVEHFLNVHAFPTYKLINRDGTVLDVNADPRDLESLARLLEKLK